MVANVLIGLAIWIAASIVFGAILGRMMALGERGATPLADAGASRLAKTA